MNILIFGGAGFVGSNLAKYLLDHIPDSTVAVVDNLHSSKLQSLGFLHSNPRFSFYLGSVQDPSFVEMVMADSDVIINCVRSYDLAEVASTIVSGTQNILESLSLDQRYIHISSYYTYGSYDVYAHTENSEAHPESVELAALRGAEEMVLAYYNHCHKNTVVLRTVDLIGKMDKESNRLGNIFASMRYGGPVAIDNTFIELLDIEDFGDAVVKTISSKCHHILNIGSGRRLAIKDIISIISSVKPIKTLPPENNVIKKYGVVSDLAYNIIGWVAQKDIKQSLSDIAHKYLTEEA